MHSRGKSGPRPKLCGGKAAERIVAILAWEPA
jgi:hypothetical protein